MNSECRFRTSTSSRKPPEIALIRPMMNYQVKHDKLFQFWNGAHRLDYKIFCAFSMICHSFYVDICWKFEKIQKVGACWCLIPVILVTLSKHFRRNKKFFYDFRKIWFTMYSFHSILNCSPFCGLLKFSALYGRSWIKILIWMYHWEW